MEADRTPKRDRRFGRLPGMTVDGTRVELLPPGGSPCAYCAHLGRLAGPHLYHGVLARVH